MIPFEDYLAQERRFIEERLESLLPPVSEPPTTLHRAMHYSVFAGGKRIRPLLVMATGRALGGDPDDLGPAACAVEMIHTYSLVHDDLPAMDNDDLRRGRATSHRVFGESIAILAGDALLTRAFEVLAVYPRRPGFDQRRVGVLATLASACGSSGMIGGQVTDIESEGRPVDEQTVHRIHQGKTGALIRAAVRTGGLLSGASDQTLDALDEYARRLGLAFQIMDDVLDVVETSAELGKTAGKDAQKQKATYPLLWGAEPSRRKAQELVRESMACVEPLGPEAVRLKQLAEYVVNRHH